MDELIALVRRLTAVPPPLTGEVLAAALAGEGWSVLRAGAAFPRVWGKGGLSAGIQGNPPEARLAVTLWLRETAEDDAEFEALEALYEEAEAESRRLAGLVADGPLGGLLEPVDAHPGEPGDGLDDYLHHRAWRLGPRTLLVGAAHQDNGLPVVVEAVVG